ncbi:membrane protein [Paenibacillus sp. CCS19]|uniref:threonine/serine exporter family protein n=1 Tax=Paenibacillus sp. CCS19 TaxID=3158387 RepID=UPI00255DDCBC|nr:threonine/serine exporter family protein [Paenibacillus cellulosilyticus]GMK40357.1 membrane protein [Paenibacillus cellulosilyticus]
MTMMTYAEEALPLIGQAVASFIAAAAFGVLFQVPKQTLLPCGVTGMVGWVAYVLLDRWLDAVPSTLIAALVVTVAAQLFARTYRIPVIVFSVAGIIPLVPGGVAYDAMRSVVENRYDESLPLAAKAFMMSGAIAIGLVLSEVVNRLLLPSKPHADQSQPEQ